jgi:hypothetical protein
LNEGHEGSPVDGNGLVNASGACPNRVCSGNSYIREPIRHGRRKPGDDLISTLVAVEEAGGREHRESTTGSRLPAVRRLVSVSVSPG